MNKKKLFLIKKLVEVSDKKNLYGTEKELFERLR